MLHPGEVPAVESNQFDIDDLQAAFLEHDQIQAERAADVALSLGRSAIEFAMTYRTPRYTEAKRENDAEHSFMLALVATELAEEFYPELDPGLISRFSIVHDLIELETGDVATFKLTPEQHAAKAAAEHAAMDKLLAKLPPATAKLLQRYEEQIEPEARFVRLIDKKLPWIVDIVGPGTLVMQEDYGIQTTEEFNASSDECSERYRNLFPEPEFDLMHKARDILGSRFAQQFES